MTCKSYTGRANINIYHGDCMEFMKNKPAKSYDLAICDPPYGLGTKTTDGGTNKNSQTKFMKDIRRTNWDNNMPNLAYFELLKQKSKEYIIWGGNYMCDMIGKTKCLIIWDKMTYITTMSQYEFAFTSFTNHSKMIKFNSTDNERQHPTQKPVALYKWLLTNYAKQGDKILDTHGGSMSIAIACWDLGYDLDIIELDKDYYDKAVQRFERHINQKQIF
jgi:site-specific DNA-methyltransferase (adenine-specific)